MGIKRILGIDPGSRQTGIGIIEVNHREYKYISSGCIRLGDMPLPQRLGEIFTRVSEVVSEYKPTELAIEEVFVKINVSSALKLGQARGVAIAAAVQQGLAVHEYSPTHIKQAIVGHGRADKSQIQHMVKVLLSLQGQVQTDAADALAVALCHAHQAAFAKSTQAKLEKWK